MVRSYAPAPFFQGSPVCRVSWLLLKVKLTALYVTKSPEHKEGHLLPKMLYLLPFTVNSQEQIILTINKTNLQGSQTLDINKDTVNIKACVGCDSPIPGCACTGGHS